LREFIIDRQFTWKKYVDKEAYMKVKQIYENKT